MPHVRIWFDILSSEKLLLVEDGKILSLAACANEVKDLEAFCSGARSLKILDGETNMIPLHGISLL